MNPEDIRNIHQKSREFKTRHIYSRHEINCNICLFVYM